MPDIELWNAFRQGDPDAFRRIYERYARDLLNYGHRVTRDVNLIEDSIHDLFIELWHAKTLSDTDSIKFYLFRALRNKINQSHRKSLFYNAGDIDLLQSSPGDFGIESHLIETEGREHLRQQLHKSYSRLSPRQQQALHLRFTMHFNNEEIARIMGINYQSACKFIYSGLKALREAVKILSIALVFLGVR